MSTAGKVRLEERRSGSRGSGGEKEAPAGRRARRQTKKDRDGEDMAGEESACQICSRSGESREREVMDGGEGGGCWGRALGKSRAKPMD